MHRVGYALLILAAAAAGGWIAAGTVFYRSGLVLGPALLGLAALLMLQQRLVGKAALLFLGGSIAAGCLGFLMEWRRWTTGGSYSFATVAGNLDIPLLCASAFAVLLPFSAMLPRVALGRRTAGHAARTKDLFGSARWMTLAEARQLFRDGSLIIGAAYDGRDPGPSGGDDAPLLTYRGDGHLLTVGGSGSGKTRTIVRPNCLYWRGPMVVLDPKGDLGRDCGPARRNLGHRVLILNPHDPASDAINVLDWLDPSTDAVVLDAQAVVSWIVDGQDAGSNAVFLGRARELIHAALIEMVCDRDLPPAERTVATLFHRLSGPEIGITVNRMEGRDPGYGWGVPRRVGVTMNNLRDADETWQGVVMFVAESLSFLQAGSAARMLSGQGRTSAPTSAILAGDTDVFVSIPIRTLTSTPAIARLVVGALLNTVYNQMALPRGQRQEVLFLLDEMPRLGSMALLEVARDAGREAGVRLWAVVQDFGQLRKAYGETGLTGWLASSAVQTYIGINDDETAQRLADAIGQTTVEATSRGTSTSRGPGGVLTSQRGINTSTSSSGAYLITPAEIRRMATEPGTRLPTEHLVLVSQLPPLRCGVVRADRRRDLLT